MSKRMQQFKIELSRKVSDKTGACVQVSRDGDGNLQLRRLDATGKPLGSALTMPSEQARLVAQAIAYTCNELFAEQALAGEVTPENVIQLVINDRKAV